MGLYRCSGENDTWPDMSGASQLTLRTERFSSVEINQIKKIGSKVYVRLKGTVAFTPTAGLQAYRLGDAPTSLISYRNYDIKIETEYENIVNGGNIYGFSMQFMYLSIIADNSTINTPVDIKVIFTEI